MKKMLFIALLCVTPFISISQVLKVINSTSCNFTITAAYADDVCGMSYIYETGGSSGSSFAAPPGTTKVTIASAAYWSPAWSPATPGWYAADICDDCGGYCITVGDACLSGPPSSTSITYSCPGVGGCSGNTYTVIWTVAGSGNAVINIF